MFLARGDVMRSYVCVLSLYLCFILFSACSTSVQTDASPGTNPDTPQTEEKSNPIGLKDSPIGELTPRQYYTQTLRPLFDRNCGGCHAPPFQGGIAPRTIFVYEAARDLLETPSPASLLGNELILKAQGVDHPGGDKCEGINNSPCAEILKWYLSEFPGPINESASPLGKLERYNLRTTTIFGWALDPNTPAQSIRVEFYEGKFPGGTQVGAIVANKPRSGLGFEGNHGFEFPLPENLKDGNVHTVYGYAIDSESAERTQLGAPILVEAHRPKAAARAYYNRAVVPVLRRQCFGCHDGDTVFYEYNDVFYILASPLPSQGGSQTNNRLILTTGGGEGHTGGNQCNGNPNPCDRFQQAWRCQFIPPGQWNASDQQNCQ